MDQQPGREEPEDRVLMQKIAAGDAASLRALYDRHAPLCFGICLRILHDRQEAEQVLIDVFAEVWRQSGRFDATRGTTSGYLAMMARSRAIDHARSLKGPATRTLSPNDAQISDASGSAQPAARSQDEEQRATIRRALDCLSAPQREAVELAFYSGLSHTEIASRLNKPVGSVKTNVRQGLIRLRDVLGEYWKAEQGST